MHGIYFIVDTDTFILHVYVHIDLEVLFLTIDSGRFKVDYVVFGRKFSVFNVGPSLMVLGPKFESKWVAT